MPPARATSRTEFGPGAWQRFVHAAAVRFLFLKFRLTSSGKVTLAEVTVKRARNFQTEMRLQNKTPDNGPGFFAQMRAASEVIVQTKAQVVCVQAIVDAGDRIGAAAEIHVEILDLRRPAGRKADLHTDAAGPTNKSLAFVEVA